MPEVRRILPTDEKRALTLNTNTTNLQPSPKPPPKDPKSTLVICALILLAAAFMTGTAAAFLAAPFVAALAVINGLAAVTLAVLSLRERI